MTVSPSSCIEPTDLSPRACLLPWSLIFLCILWESLSPLPGMSPNLPSLPKKMKYSGVTTQGKGVRKASSQQQAITKFFFNLEIAVGRAETAVVSHKLCHLCAIKGSEHSFILSFSFWLRKDCVLFKKSHCTGVLKGDRETVSLGFCVQCSEGIVPCWTVSWVSEAGCNSPGVHSFWVLYASCLESRGPVIRPTWNCLLATY